MYIVCFKVAIERFKIANDLQRSLKVIAKLWHYSILYTIMLFPISCPLSLYHYIVPFPRY